MENNFTSRDLLQCSRIAWLHEHMVVIIFTERVWRWKVIWIRIACAAWFLLRTTSDEKGLDDVDCSRGDDNITLLKENSTF